MTHDSFAISEAIDQQFEDEHGVTVEILPSGDAGAMLNQAISARTILWQIYSSVWTTVL